MQHVQAGLLIKSQKLTKIILIITTSTSQRGIRLMLYYYSTNAPPTQLCNVCLHSTEDDSDCL